MLGGEGLLVRKFKWIEWNLEKIDSHGLTPEDVESAFSRVYRLQKRKDDSFQMYAETPSGRRIWIIWRYDRDCRVGADVFGELEVIPIFVITAY